MIPHQRRMAYTQPVDCRETAQGWPPMSNGTGDDRFAAGKRDREHYHCLRMQCPRTVYTDVSGVSCKAFKVATSR